MRLGRVNILRIQSLAPQGFYLEDTAGERVLLPAKYCPETARIGDEIRVFVYCDSLDRPVATTREPFAYAGDFTCLEVVQVNEIGAFLDWGLEKHLLLPFRNQVKRVKQGDKVVVFVDVDRISGRMVATQKLKAYFNKNVQSVAAGETLDALIYQVRENFVRVVTAGGFDGIVRGSLGEHAFVGESLRVRVRAAQVDHLDLSPEIDVFAEDIQADGEYLLNVVRARGGFLSLHDRSDPREISALLGWSKKRFKRVSGWLLKRKKIILVGNGIQLLG